MQAGFVGLWDSINTIMKGLVCTAPLLLTSASAYLGLALTTTATYTMGALACTGLATVGSMACTALATVGSFQCNVDALVKGLLTVNGNIWVNGTLNPDALIWVGGRVYGANATINQTTFAGSWSVTRSSGQATGYYRITFSSAHPIGTANYSVFVTGFGGNAVVRATTAPPTTTYFEVVTTTPTGVSADVSFSFMVMNW